MKILEILDEDAFVREFISEGLSEQYSLEFEILRYVEDQDKTEIGHGIFNGTTDIRDIVDRFSHQVKSTIGAHLLKHFKAEGYFLSLDDIVSVLIIQTIERLVSKGFLLYIYDVNRVKSRIGEIVRYLHHLRRRLEPGDYERVGSPDLTQGIKLAIEDREHPKRDLPANDVLSKLKDQFLAGQIQDPLLKFYQDKITESLEVFKKMLNALFPDGFFFSSFQKEALISAFTCLTRNENLMIAAGTGTGKTEAFLFPILLYCLITRQTPGLKAILTYPRIALSNDQFLRVVKYLYPINEELRKQGASQKDLIHVYIEHSRANPNEELYPCPFCEDAGRVSTLSYRYDSERGRHVLRCPEETCPMNRAVDYVRFSREEGWHFVHFYDPNQKTPDILIVTCDSLHLRMMAHWYRHFFGTLWKCQDCGRYYKSFQKSCIYRPKEGEVCKGQIRAVDTTLTGDANNWWALPRFMVIDEIHVYSDHYGGHVNFLIKRLYERLQNISDGAQKPIFIGSSATIANPLAVARGIFPGTARLITPKKDDMSVEGREYFIFIKSTFARGITTRTSRYLNEISQEEFTELEAGGVASISCMIQAAFCLFHNMLKTERKRRNLLFIDSIDLIGRLGRQLYDADTIRQLFSFRLPIARYIQDDPRHSERTEHTNILCPQQGGTFGILEPLCGVCPPNPLLHGCKVYEDGECWFLTPPGEEPMNIQVHSSAGGTSIPIGKHSYNVRLRAVDLRRAQDWDVLMTTSALEVGFDHPELIAIMQYMAPRSPVNFAQRKGRGGRGVKDMPISMVIFTDSADDNHYYKFEENLVHPEFTEIPICDSFFLRQQHAAAAVLDFISTTATKEGIPRAIFDNGDMSRFNSYLKKRRREAAEWVHRATELPLDDCHRLIETMLTHTDHMIEKIPFEGYSQPDYKTEVWRYGRTDTWKDHKTPNMGKIKKKIKENAKKIKDLEDAVASLLIQYFNRLDRIGALMALFETYKAAREGK